MRRYLIKYLLILILMLLKTHLFSQQIEMELKPPNISLSFNGTFVYNSPVNNSKANSPDGTFWCQYEIGRVSDEERDLINFKFYENSKLLFAMNKAPGSDLYISNSGFIAFMDMRHHYKNELVIHFFSKLGQQLFSETFKRAALFGFSSKGNKFGVDSAVGLQIISMLNHQIETYENGYQFDISEDDSLVAVALRGKAKVYSHGNLIRELKTDFIYTRKIKISSKSNIVAVIDKKQLKVFSLSNGNLIFTDSLKGRKSYRDLFLKDGKIFTGIHSRDNGISKGILKVLNHWGDNLFEKEEVIKQIKSFKVKETLKKSSSGYEQLPWPFMPFDEMHTVWNHYEQHMGSGISYSYLHQGLDIITPIAEPTFAVKGGVVKCVLTIGGQAYWRTAISPEQNPGFSKGWLYAHLIQSTIQFDVGDTVQLHDYLGEIICWAENWGHIHFVEIQDSGLVWEYSDNEWGITYNPLLSLLTPADTIAPIIENVFDTSKFAFCLNETSDYLNPDSLYSDIDIIIKVVDYVGGSPWQQPAYETYYWVKKIPDNEIVFSRTLGQILNHSYPFYSSGKYEPYATVIYKRDQYLRGSSWMSRQRNYHHILTNSNGDSIIDLSEKELAFSTTDYPDGDYRIFFEARDEYGNSTIDSMDVKFKNGITSVSEIRDQVPSEFQLDQNYPNPFNPMTKIGYSIPKSGIVKLKVYDILGTEIITLVNEFQNAGTYSVDFNAWDFTSGIYLYELSWGKFSGVKKMLLIR